MSPTAITVATGSARDEVGVADGAVAGELAVDADAGILLGASLAHPARSIATASCPTTLRLSCVPAPRFLPLSRPS